MRRWIPFLVGAMLLAVGILWQAAQPAAGVVRIHIIANSDDLVDQQVKLKVRNALLAALGDGWDSADACFSDLTARSGELAALAAQVLADQGMDYGARAETGSYLFPTRVYGDESWPAGRYRALKVVLGDGAGQNWWCVLYPQLCLQPYPTPAQMDAVTGAAPAVRTSQAQTAAATAARPQATRTPDATAEPVEVRSWVWDHWVPQRLKQAWQNSQFGLTAEQWLSQGGMNP